MPEWFQCGKRCLNEPRTLDRLYLPVQSPRRARKRARIVRGFSTRFLRLSGDEANFE